MCSLARLICLYTIVEEKIERYIPGNSATQHTLQGLA